jgi:molybdenum transport protein
LGGVVAATATDFVRAGAGLIVTSAPYSARPCDVTVRIVAVS